ncbi:MAG: thioredoxin [Candidatus Geothermincolales bacterium]
MAGKVVELSAENFSQEVLEAEGPVLVDFWAPWCNPCRMMAPVLEEAAEEWAGKIKVCKLNVDENQDLARKYDIQSIPTLILFHRGEAVKRTVGARPKSALQEEFRDWL